MSARKKSVDSFGEFFGGEKPATDVDEKQSKEGEISSPAEVTSPFKSQPVIHHPRTASDTKCKILFVSKYIYSIELKANVVFI